MYEKGEKTCHSDKVNIIPLVGIANMSLSALFQKIPKLSWVYKYND